MQVQQQSELEGWNNTGTALLYSLPPCFLTFSGGQSPYFQALALP
jgi:hypothetical protein